MSPPEGGPGLIPFAEAENKELRWPEEGPGAVGEVAVSTIISMQVEAHGRLVLWAANLQHAIRFVPMQVMLDIHRRLRLYRKSHQTH